MSDKTLDFRFVKAYAWPMEASSELRPSATISPQTAYAIPQRLRSGLAGFQDARAIWLGVGDDQLAIMTALRI